MDVGWISKFRVNLDFAQNSVSPLDCIFDYSDFRYRKDYPQKIRRKQNQGFEINKVPSIVTDRLVELLPSLSRRILSFTCKKFYILSMKHCGLEVEYLQNGNSKQGVAQNGKLYIDLSKIPEKFYPFLNVHLLKYNPANNPGLYCRIPKNYDHFLIEHETENLQQGLDQLYPGVKTATFILSFISDNLKIFRGFKNFLESLNNVERLYIRMDFFGSDPIPVDELKKILNDWFSFRKTPLKELYFYCRPSHDDTYDDKDYIHVEFKSDENIQRKRKKIEDKYPKNPRLFDSNPVVLL